MRHFNRGTGHCLFATQYLCKLRPAAKSFRPKTNLPLACRTCTRLNLGLQLAMLDPTRVSFSTFAASLLRSNYVRPVQSCISVNFHMHASIVVIHVRIASSSNQSDREVDVITGRGIVVACLNKRDPVGFLHYRIIPFPWGKGLEAHVIFG